MKNENYEKMRNNIQEAFIEIYTKNNFSEISVKKVCNKVNISRTTFYNYYGDLYEVIEDIEDKLIFQLKAINKTFAKQDFKKYSTVESFDYFNDTLFFIEENSNCFRTLMRNSRDGQFIYKWKKIIKEDFTEKYKTEQIYLKNNELVMEMITSAIIGTYEYWLYHLDEISINDVANEVLYKLCKDFI